MLLKASRNGISRELLSYMTYILQPTPRPKTNINVELMKSLKNKYYQKLEKVGNNVTKLLDLVTRTCEDYIQNNWANCTRDFMEHHYALGGKCFPSTGTTQPGNPVSYELEIVAPASRYENIDISIAGIESKTYTGLFLYVFDRTKNLHAYHYDDLTPIKVGMYTLLKVDKSSTDRTAQHRVIDPYQCNINKSYRNEDCVRKANFLIFYL